MYQRDLWGIIPQPLIQDRYPVSRIFNQSIHK